MNYNQGCYMDDYTNNASYINYPQNNDCDSQGKFLKQDDNDKCMCCMRTVCYYPVSWEDDCRKKDEKKPCEQRCEKEEKRPCCRFNEDWNNEKYDCNKKKYGDDCYEDKKSNHCGCKKEENDKKHCENNYRYCRNNRCCGWFCRGFHF